MTSKIDFSAIRAANKAKLEANAEALKKQMQRAPIPTASAHKGRVQHLVDEHLADLTEWEADFCYSQLEYLSKNAEARGTEKIRGVLTEIESKTCGSDCCH